MLVLIADKDMHSFLNVFMCILTKATTVNQSSCKNNSAAAAGYINRTSSLYLIKTIQYLTVFPDFSPNYIWLLEHVLETILWKDTIPFTYLD